jgi:hypothetical protein
MPAAEDTSGNCDDRGRQQGESGNVAGRREGRHRDCTTFICQEQVEITTR